jgi:predicted SprT family Zn-dependent metalloprotease
MYVFSRNKNIIGGYFAPEKWENEDGKRIPEIALNANLMKVTDLSDAYNTIIHEQVHFWQTIAGKPSRNGYHNQEWADKCKEIGLQPKTSDGKETGQAVDTELIPGGKAEQLIADILVNQADEYVFPWYAEGLMIDADGNGRGQTEDEKRKDGEKQNDENEKKSGKRDKYTCAMCGTSVWGKAGLNIICGDCNRPLVNGR